MQAEVHSQRIWCGGEGVQGVLECARGTRAQEDRICVEERVFREHWGARRARGEVDV